MENILSKKILRSVDRKKAVRMSISKSDFYRENMMVRKLAAHVKNIIRRVNEIMEIPEDLDVFTKIDQAETSKEVDEMAKSYC